MKILLLLVLTLLAKATAQIAVNGISTRSTYTGEAIFTVPSEIGFSISAELNGNPVPLDTSTTESGPGYHELLLTKTPEAGGTSETETIQFIVRDPNRPSSDNGISTWAPLPSVAAPPTVLDETTVEFITPCAVTPGMTFPIVVRLTNTDGKIARLNANSLISDSSGNAETLKLRRGAGAGSWTATSELPFVITLHLGSRTFSREIFVNPFPPQFLGGELTESTDIISGTFIGILSNITVPAEMTLRFGEDCLVQIPPGVTIEVLGKLEIAGSPDNPTLFYTQDPTRPWGGIFLRGGAASAEIDGAFFTGGGAESNWTSDNGFSSHRKEQPILAFDAGTSGGTCIATLNDVWIIDNPTAQAGHGRNADLTFENCLIQRATTAGQYNGGTFNFLNSHAIEFPIESPNFSDEDNDALYLTAGAHHIRGSVIGWTKDDGIDCGGSQEGTLLVEDSWIDSCFHEGFALSGDKLVTITNTVSINNGQGLEVGYSGSLNRPDATATNMLLIGNAHGARYGDNYDWDYNGKLSVSDSLILHNRADVFGFEWDSWTYREADMSIENNVITSALARHPDNTVFAPETHSSQIAAFLESGREARGFAVIDRAPQNPRSDYGGRVSIHLDRPASSTITIPWQVVSPDTVIQSGVLELTSGEVSKSLPLPELLPPHDSAPWLALKFQDSLSAVATGPAHCHFIDLPGGASPANTVLISFNSNWRFLGDGSDQGTAWREPDFDDSSWSSGDGQLGYGDGDETTDVGFSGTNSTKNATTYFRHQFDVQSPETFASIELDLLFDDGAIVHLNGNRIAAANMPDGDASFDFYTGSTSSDNERETFNIAPSLLLEGTNTVAVEVHQEGGSSSDISFDLEMVATPLPEPGIQSLTAPLQGDSYLLWTTRGAFPQTSTDLKNWLSRPGLPSPLKITPDTVSPARQFYRLRKSN
jgi:hypothetical protein